MGPSLPFSARNVLVDIHRVFFKRLPIVKEEGPLEGWRRGTLDGEEVSELWRGGMLLERRYLRPEFAKRAVRVLYGPGCRSDRCEPENVHVVNEWFGYSITIENRRYQALQKS